MGIQAHSFIEIISLRKFIYGEILVISKLRLFLHPSEIRKILILLESNEQSLFKDYKFGDFCDIYISKLFPNNKISFLDFSNYEGADILHDLNFPILSKITNRFSLIIEGGTLEHIFNFPVAIKNLMQMLVLDGFLILNVPSNNQSGHGFYQFSSELFYRVFDQVNGFKIVKLELYKSKYPSVELSINHLIGSPVDTKISGSRAQFLSCFPVMIFLVTTRVEYKNIFDFSVLQSDYVISWKSSSSYLVSNFYKDYLIRTLPHSFLTFIKGLREKNFYNLKNKKNFKIK